MYIAHIIRNELHVGIWMLCIHESRYISSIKNSNVAIHTQQFTQLLRVSKGITDAYAAHVQYSSVRMLWRIFNQSDGLFFHFIWLVCIPMTRYIRYIHLISSETQEHKMPPTLHATFDNCACAGITSWFRNSISDAATHTRHTSHVHKLLFRECDYHHYAVHELVVNSILSVDHFWIKIQGKFSKQTNVLIYSILIFCFYCVRNFVVDCIFAFHNLNMLRLQIGQTHHSHILFSIA